jgi:tetratricopeptide (TPR) repeat protein
MPVSVQTRQAGSRPEIALLGLRPWKRGRLAVCLFACFAFMGSAAGQETLSNYVSPTNPADVYLDAIDEIEGDYGPYATELSDLYLGLGQTLFDLGEYDRARDAFNRGVMVQRVNLGPNSPEQTNHLYVLANLEFLLGRQRTANEILENIHFINSEYYGEDSPEMLPVLERMYAWYLTTNPPGLTGTDFGDYEQAIELTEEMVDVSEVAYGPHHLETAKAYRLHGEAQFQMVLFLRGFQSTLIEDRYMTISNRARFPVDLANDYFHDGRKAFDNYLEALLADESTTVQDHAFALRELGDWYLLIEKYRSSWKLYEEGYSILLENKEFAELADTYMDQPVPMHFVEGKPPALGEEEQPEPEETWYEISLTVTQSGKLRSIEFVDPPEQLTNDDRRQVKIQVQDIPFRPAMKEGKVVTTKEFIWRYRILPEEEAS